MACTAVRSFGGAIVSVAEHALAPGYRMARHEHRGPSLVVGLAGAWVAEVRGVELGCGRDDVVLLPDGAAHSELAPAGSRCLLVTLAGDPARLGAHRRVSSPTLGALGIAVA